MKSAGQEFCFPALLSRTFCPHHDRAIRPKMGGKLVLPPCLKLKTAVTRMKLLLAVFLLEGVTLSANLQIIVTYLYKVDVSGLPRPCLHAHLPPGLLVIIVADAPSISQQRAGER